MLYLGVITQPAALCLLPFHRTSPVGPQHFPLGLPVYRPLLPDVPWLPTLSTGMKSLKATLFPSLPSPSLISFWRSPSWWWCLGEGTLSLLHMEDREQSCWGLMACPSSFPLLPLRGEQKTGFKYLKSEFGPKNLIIFWRATAANGHSQRERNATESRLWLWELWWEAPQVTRDLSPLPHCFHWNNNCSLLKATDLSYA